MQEDKGIKDMVKLDVRYMSCSQSAFKVKKIAINNTEKDFFIEILNNEKPSAENIIRRCLKFRYTSTYNYTDNNEIIIILKKLKYLL